MSIDARVAIKALVAVELSADTNAVIVKLATGADTGITLEFPSDTIETVAAGFIAARNAVGGRAGKDHAIIPQTWDVGVTRMTGHVIVTYDRSIASHRAYAFVPPVAREMGRALIAAARTSEHTDTKLAANKQ